MGTQARQRERERKKRSGRHGEEEDVGRRAHRSPFARHGRGPLRREPLLQLRTVERGRLLCVVLCMLQLGLHPNNYCCGTCDRHCGGGPHVCCCGAGWWLCHTTTVTERHWCKVKDSVVFKK